MAVDQDSAVSASSSQRSSSVARSATQRPQVRVQRQHPLVVGGRGRQSGRAAGSRGRAACRAGAPAGPAPCGRPGPRPRRSAPPPRRRPPAAPPVAAAGPPPRRAARRRARYSSTPPGSIASWPSPSSATDAVGDPLEEVAVVGDHDQRAGPAVEEVLEHGQGLDVEVVGRLVEQQHVGLGQQQPQQLEPPPLAAGQVADRAVQPVAGEAEPLAAAGVAVIVLPVAEVDPRRTVSTASQHPQRRGRARSTSWVRCAGATVRPRSTRPAVGASVAGEQPQHRGLAGAVDADDADPVARAEPPGRRATSSAARRRPRGRRPRRRRRPCRAAGWRTAAARAGRAAAARRRSARWRRRSGTSASRSAPAARGAARPAPCAPGSAAAPRWPPPAAPARPGRARTPRSRPRTRRTAPSCDLPGRACRPRRGTTGRG